MSAEEELRQLILVELRDLRKDVRELRDEMTTLKVKVAFFGSLAGAIGTFLYDRLLR